MDNVKSQLRNSLTFVEAPVKAVGYCRVSTDDQADHGSSLDSQEQAIADFAAANGYELVQMFREDYSGYKLNRPELDQVRGLLGSGKANSIIVHTSDRLSRHRTHSMMLVDEFLESGIRLFTAQDGKEIDLTDDTEVMLFSLKSNLSHSEGNKIKERTTRGRRTRTQEGRIVTAKPPYGYRIHKITETTPGGRIITVDRQLAVDSEAAAVVELIYDLYAYKGYSIRKLMKYLEEQGCQLSYSKINYILRNKAYIGDYSYSGIQLEIPAILEPDLWYTVESKRENNKRVMRQKKHYHYPFSGRVTCGACGGPMRGVSNQLKTPYYRCNKYGDSRYDECDRTHYPALKIETLVMDWIAQLMSDPETVRQGLLEYQELMLQQHKPLLDDYERIEKLVLRDKNKLTRLLDLYLEGSLDKETYLSRKLSLGQSIQAAEESLSEQKETLALIESFPDQIQSVEQLTQITQEAFAEGIPPEETRELIEALDVRVELSNIDGKKMVTASCIIGSSLLTGSS